MSQESRIKRWRTNKRQQGLKHVSVWLTPEEELRLKDLAIQWHCSPSYVVQRALAQISSSPPEYSSPTDALHIRALIREELAAMQAIQAQDTVGSAVGPTETLPQESSPETLSTHTYESAPGHSLVTEPTPQRTKRSQTRSYGEVPAAVLATLAHQQPMTPAEIAKVLRYNTKQGTKAVWQALERLCKSGKVRQEGKRYRLAPEGLP